MTVAKKPARKSPPEATPTSAQLEEATRKSAIAKTKARNAKAALKNAKKTFKLARKAAKAARKRAEALQEAITRAEEAAAAAAAIKTSAARRTPSKDLPRAPAGSEPPLPVKRKAVRKRSGTSSSAPLGPGDSHEATSNPTPELEGSTLGTDGSTLNSTAEVEGSTWKSIRNLIIGPS